MSNSAGIAEIIRRANSGSNDNFLSYLMIAGQIDVTTVDSYGTGRGDSTSDKTKRRFSRAILTGGKTNA